MSRVSSSVDTRDFHVYPVLQRLWQSTPDLRLEKWKPQQANTSIDESALDVVDMMKASKKQFLEQLFRERTAEAESYQ